MDSPGLVILTILAIGAIFILLPIALLALSEHKRPRNVVCPETGRLATIGLDSGRAARGAIFGKEWLSVQDCTLWPEKEGCAQVCVAAKPAELSPTA